MISPKNYENESENLTLSRIFTFIYGHHRKTSKPWGRGLKYTDFIPGRKLIFPRKIHLDMTLRPVVRVQSLEW